MKCRKNDILKLSNPKDDNGGLHIITTCGRPNLSEFCSVHPFETHSGFPSHSQSIAQQPIRPWQDLSQARIDEPDSAIESEAPENETEGHTSDDSESELQRK